MSNSDNGNTEAFGLSGLSLGSNVSVNNRNARNAPPGFESAPAFTGIQSSNTFAANNSTGGGGSIWSITPTNTAPAGPIMFSSGISHSNGAAYGSHQAISRDNTTTYRTDSHTPHQGHSAPGAPLFPYNNPIPRGGSPFLSAPYGSTHISNSMYSPAVPPGFSGYHAPPPASIISPATHDASKPVASSGRDLLAMLQGGGGGLYSGGLSSSMHPPQSFHHSTFGEASMRPPGTGAMYAPMNPTPYMYARAPLQYAPPTNSNYMDPRHMVNTRQAIYDHEVRERERFSPPPPLPTTTAGLQSTSGFKKKKEEDVVAVIEVYPERVETNGKIEIRWSIQANSHEAGDIVALYRAGQVNAADKAITSRPANIPKNFNKRRNSIVTNVIHFRAPKAVGKFDFRYFHEGNEVPVARSNVLNVHLSNSGIEETVDFLRKRLSDEDSYSSTARQLTRVLEQIEDPIDSRAANLLVHKYHILEYRSNIYIYVYIYII